MSKPYLDLVASLASRAHALLRAVSPVSRCGAAGEPGWRAVAWTYRLRNRCSTTELRWPPHSSALFLPSDASPKAGFDSSFDSNPGQAPAQGLAAMRSAASRWSSGATGVEEALTLQQGFGIPTWATLGTRGLRAVEFPPLPFAVEVVIGANADKDGREAAQASVQRFRSEGRRTRLMFPPDGLNDSNDALRAELGGRRRGCGD